MRFNDFISSIQRDELPRMAVREAIVNAVCHRDYESNGAGKSAKRNRSREGRDDCWRVVEQVKAILVHWI